MEENVKNLDEQKTTSTIKIKIEVKSLKIRSERHGEAEMTPINKQETSFDINFSFFFFLNPYICYENRSNFRNS